VIVVGDARETKLPSRSVDLVVTSPPYFGLRTYGALGEIGGEATPAEYVKAMTDAGRRASHGPGLPRRRAEPRVRRHRPHPGVRVTAVLGVDPGGTTGVALVAFKRGRYHLYAHRGLVGTAAEVAADLQDKGTELMMLGVPVAVERFVVSRRAGRSSSAAAGEKARHIIGALETSGAHLHRATASEVKRWATDKRLAAAGLRPTQGLPHTRDACRHALYTLVKHYGCPDPLGRRYQEADQ
jgi:hypothetical protein